MDTTTTPAPVTDPHPPPQRRRAALIAGGIAVGVLVLVAVTLVGLKTARPGALPGIVVAGRDVAGLERSALVTLLDEVGAQRAALPLSVRRDEAVVPATGADLGYRLDSAATADEVLSRGRQANPVTALGDQLRAFWAPTVLSPVEPVDPVRLNGFLQRTADELQVAPVEGTLRLRPSGARAVVERVEPAPGAVVQADALRADVERALRDDTPDVLAAPMQPRQPLTTPSDVDAVEVQARRALSAPVRLTRGDGALDLAPNELARVLAVRFDPSMPSSLSLAVDERRLERAVTDSTREAIESPPVDADFAVSNGRVRVVPARDGFRFDPPRAAAQLLMVATGPGRRVAALDGEAVPPARTTDEARALGITERVSTFTTRHPCCEPRVTNIHRAADILDGTIVEPGQTFSLNDTVGERTVSNGFVAAPAILEGQYVQDVGGGTSQLATTLFNAIFYGGYDVLEHKPHTYYISRYPAGRESTVNYPNVDVKFRNDSPGAVVIKTGYSDTSVTVSFYGTKWVKVDERSSGRFNQQGNGFDIVITRLLRFPDGRRDSERFSTHYENEPADAHDALDN